MEGAALCSHQKGHFLWIWICLSSLNASAETTIYEFKNPFAVIGFHIVLLLIKELMLQQT